MAASLRLPAGRVEIAVDDARLLCLLAAEVVHVTEEVDRRRIAAAVGSHLIMVDFLLILGGLMPGCNVNGCRRQWLVFVTDDMIIVGLDFGRRSRIATISTRSKSQSHTHFVNFLVPNCLRRNGVEEPPNSPMPH